MSATDISSNQAKYESGNPIQVALIQRFQRRVVELLRAHRFGSVLDVGCGEGFLARVLFDAFPGVSVTGVDLSASAVEGARRRCPEGRFEQASFDDVGALAERFDLVVCSEVLEHLDAPRQALDVLADRAQRLALLTVPWEPWFQLANFARGKYVRTLGNHPEHVQHWGVRAFEREVGGHFAKLHLETSFPWIVFLGAPVGPPRGDA